MPRRAIPKPDFIAARPATLPKLVEGSKRVLCMRCRKTHVWATPYMLANEMDTKLVCPKCAPSPRKVA